MVKNGKVIAISVKDARGANYEKALDEFLRCGGVRKHLNKERVRGSKQSLRLKAMITKSGEKDFYC